MGSSLDVLPSGWQEAVSEHPWTEGKRAQSQDMAWWEPGSHAEILVRLRGGSPRLWGGVPGSDLTLPWLQSPTSGCPADGIWMEETRGHREVIGKRLSLEQGWNPHPVPQAPSGCTPTPNMTLTVIHRDPGTLAPLR